MHVFALYQTKLAFTIQRKPFPFVLPGEHNEVELSKEATSFDQHYYYLNQLTKNT